MIILISLMAFLLENFASLYLNYQPFISLFVISTLVVIYPIYKNNNNDYLKYCLLMGILYDIIFTNTLFLNAFLFLVVGLSIIKLNLFLINNLLSTIIMVSIVIIIYLSSSYLLLSLFSEVDFVVVNLFKQIANSLLINIIYGLFIFVLLEKLSKKYKIEKMN